MTKNRVKILGVGIDPLTIVEANDQIAKFVAHPSKDSQYVVKPYVEFMTKAAKDIHIAKILNDANLVLADGVSLQWAASYLYGQPKKKIVKIIRSGLVWLRKPEWIDQILPAKMAGASQTMPLFELAEQQAWRVGVLGGPANTNKLKLSLQTLFPDLTHLFVWNGYFDKHQEPKLIEQIQDAQLDVLFVAMGFPLQEQFIHRHLKDNLATVLIGEGGTFDYDQFGGDISRAPAWMQRAGLEWLWRLLRQPSRLWRQLAIPKFVWQVYKQSRKTN